MKPSTSSPAYLERLLADAHRVLSSEKPWRCPLFSLSTLAGMLHVPAAVLTQAFTAGGKTFRTVINDYRVREAKAVLERAPDMAPAEVARKAGFGSVSLLSKHYRSRGGDPGWGPGRRSSRGD